ncbi:OmpH family outer membrane protein [Komagataeibacter nataicola]|nr:OmpH family outer membrane protein [Komagataeibacter nataicola]WEQ55524.1 OmpH family outer membrane protein [Komagataeibacter nataicola]WNM09620.1 OmpH family outer membrane protein [Komagataeibacter nataicola]
MAPTGHARLRGALCGLAIALTPALAMAQDAGGQQQNPILPMPPVPEFKPLPAGTKPAAPVIGIFNTQQIMAQSTAVQKLQTELSNRREALVKDVRAEDTQLQALRQSIIKAGKAPTPEQQQDLQKRVMADRTKFGNRNRILEEDAQVALNQVQREMQQIVSAIAAARGMNMVLQAGTAALHDNSLDISDQVVTYLNQALPTVYLPGPTEDPEEIAKSGKYPVMPFQPADNGGE